MDETSRPNALERARLSGRQPSLSGIEQEISVIETRMDETSRPNALERARLSGRQPSLAGIAQEPSVIETRPDETARPNALERARLSGKERSLSGIEQEPSVIETPADGEGKKTEENDRPLDGDGRKMSVEASPPRQREALPRVVRRLDEDESFLLEGAGAPIDTSAWLSSVSGPSTTRNAPSLERMEPQRRRGRGKKRLDRNVPPSNIFCGLCASAVPLQNGAVTRPAASGARWTQQERRGLSAAGSCSPSRALGRSPGASGDPRHRWAAPFAPLGWLASFVRGGRRDLPRSSRPGSASP
jgi:hypothetical protein